MTLLTNSINFLQSIGLFSCLLNEADEFKEIQDGRSEMAHPRWRIPK